ncbi:MAG TPA: efflux RND transporter permease subunit [Stellaceae bacterium]|nr:efflux RND transporter permease subunit [Stellaceae bacterium]
MAGGPGLQAALVRFSIRFRGIVIALACVLLGYGIYTALGASYDVFPEFAPPQVQVRTDAPGLAPDQVEILVTQPLENAINGVPGLRTLESSSIQGLSVITATFQPSSDVYRDRQLLSERLGQATGQLPAGTEPMMTPLTSSTNLVLVAGLTSRRVSLMDLQAFAEWTVRPRLLAEPGVASVAIFARDRRSIEIQIHPAALIRFGVGLNDVVNAARRATGVRGGGFVDTSNQRITVRSEGQSLTPAEIARTVLVSTTNGRVRLGDVASVRVAPEPPVGAAAIDGRPAIVFNIYEQYGANTLRVTQRLDGALAALRPGLEQAGIELHPRLFRPADFIATATGNVDSSLLLGGLLVSVVLFLFLFDLRSAAISCVAIPLSLLAALIVVQRLGLTLNTMTLGGLAIAIGVVVDDAVVDLENILRRLRENGQAAMPLPTAKVVLDACLEVRGAVVYATFAVILVVLPILALSGLAGRLFAPLGIAYALAVLASLLVALTAVPALAMVLLAGGKSNEREPPLMRWSKAGYRALLRPILRHPRSAAAAAGVLTIAGFAVLPLLGGSYIPELKEDHFIVHMATVPGTSIAESLRLGGVVTRALRQLPAVRWVAQRVGRATFADDTYGTNYSEFEVELKPLDGAGIERAKAQIRRTVAAIPGGNFTINTFLTERIEEVSSGYTAPVVVNIFGRDLDLLDQKAQQVARVLAGVPGAADVQVRSPPGMPQVAVRLRAADLDRWGLDPVDVLDALRTAYQGDTVGEVYDGNRVFPVVAILDPADRTGIGRIADLPLRTPTGSFVPLHEIADVTPGSGRYEITHLAAQRVETVTSDVAGRDLASFVQAAEARVAHEVSLPTGTYLEFAGQAQAQSRAQRDLIVNSLVAGIGIVLLLSVVCRRANNLLLVLANLPFAFVGGVFAVLASNGILSLGSMVGFVALFGIALRNAILVIAHYDHLVVIEGREWTIATALDGAADRLIPILMTSLVTALGVLPLAVGMNEPGREIEGPMAVVILGGLVSALALNLLVLPALAYRYGRFAPVRRDRFVEPPAAPPAHRPSPAE